MSETQNKRILTTKQIVYCSILTALALACSYLKLIPMPFGGSVTLFSMLFICLTGYWYGIRAGLITGFVYGLLQFLQEPHMLTPFQVCCDYLLAFTALGLSGLFRHSGQGLIKGYLLGVVVRGAFHVLGGYLYWMAYIPDNFPSQFAAIYPFIYNYSYLLTEAALTVIVILLPPVKQTLIRLKQSAS